MSNYGFELKPIDGRKSFYGKARVIETEHGYYLQSYDTLVCYFDKFNRNNPYQFCKLWNDYSATTMRHINAFMHFNGSRLGGKKWWMSLECNKLYNVEELYNM